MEPVDEDGGYDLEFVSVPSDYLTCLICQSVARLPWQHSACGRVFCKSCLDKYQKRYNTCPSCRERNANYFKDNKSNREVMDLLVKCEGAKNGCKWEGEIRYLDQHKSTCLHVPVPCPQECDVGSVLRGDLQSHLRDYCSQRDYECPHCLQMGRYRERVTSHLQDCPMVLTECPNEGCEEMLCSSLILFHVSTNCPFTVLQCRYSEAGCKVQLTRRDLEEHEQHDRLHLQVATTKIADLQHEVDKLKTANAVLQSDMKKTQVAQAVLHKTLTMKDKTILKLQGFGQHKTNGTVYDSPSFYSKPRGYNMHLRVYPNGTMDGKGTHVSVFAFMDEGDYDNELSWPFVGEITVTLLNQLKDEKHIEKTVRLTANNDMRVGKGRGSSKSIPHHALVRSWARNTQYLKNDTLYFMVSVSVPNTKPWLACTV